MPFDYQKLGLDRAAQNIARAINNPGSSVVTGDITRGEVVVVEFKAPGAASAEATVKTRRTGAIPLGMSYTGNVEYKWGFSGDKLVVETNGTIEGSFTFWVF